MKIALVQTPAFGIDRPPIALGYLTAIVRKHGFAAEIFDLNSEFYSRLKEEDRKLWQFRYVPDWTSGEVFLHKDFMPGEYFERWARQILDSDPDVIGFSLQSSSLKSALRLAGEIKNNAPGRIVVFGGPLNLSYSLEHAYHLLGLENSRGIKVTDVIVLGEGEETLVDILTRMDKKKSLTGCPGTIIRDGARIINNGLRPLIRDLNALPFPDFDGLTTKYRYRNSQHKNVIPILGSRGCVHKCMFCDDVLMWRYYRFRSAENILEEMKLRKKEGAEFLDFNDLLINGNRRELSRLCDMLIEEGLGIRWGGSATISKNMDYNFLMKIKSAGCGYLNYGIESASPKILRDINKDFLIEEAQKVIEDTHSAGMKVATNWIVGFPTETREDFQATLDFIRENIRYLKSGVMVNSFILKDNSLVCKNRDKFGIIYDRNGNWSSCGGLNTYEERKRRFDEFIEFLSRLQDAPAHTAFQ